MENENRLILLFVVGSIVIAAAYFLILWMMDVHPR
jgi:hypothetical protein